MRPDSKQRYAHDLAAGFHANGFGESARQAKLAGLVSLTF